MSCEHARTRAVLVPAVAAVSEVREAGVGRAGRLFPFRVGSRRSLRTATDTDTHLSGSFVRNVKVSLISNFTCKQRLILMTATATYISRPLFSKLHAPADVEVIVVNIWFTLLNFKIYSVRCTSVASFTYIDEDCSVARRRQAG